MGISIQFPRSAGEWEVENIGIAPDLEVEQNPALMSQGLDPQLEKAIQVVMDLLAKQPPATHKRAPIPDYKPVLPDSAQ
jgi:tricorn protease